MKKKNSITAAELMEKLQKDKSCQDRITERDKRIAKRNAAMKEEEKWLAKDLAEVGIEVESAWDLVNYTTPYPQAIPILLKHFQLSYSDRVKEGIARSLAVPDAGQAWDVLKKEFEKGPEEIDDGVKFAIGCAISVIAQARGRLEEVLEILRNSRHGTNRLAVLDALALSPDPKIRAKLRGFTNDPDIEEEAQWYIEHPGQRRK